MIEDVEIDEKDIENWIHDEHFLYDYCDKCINS
jgi:hypothetical protein